MGTRFRNTVLQNLVHLNWLKCDLGLFLLLPRIVLHTELVLILNLVHILRWSRYEVVSLVINQLFAVTKQHAAIILVGVVVVVILMMALGLV